MTRPDPHERFEELAAGHAMHALEPEDEQAFLVHLASCARCERDTAVHRETLAHLAYAPDEAEPPTGLLDGIRAGVLASGRGASFPSTEQSPPAVEQPVQLDAARRRRDALRLRRAGTWTGIAAAAALVVGLGTWNASLRQDRDAQDAWSDRISTAVGALEQAGTKAVRLGNPEGEVLAVALVRDSDLSLVVDGLPVNDDATTYVLWGQSRYGDVRPVGAFDVHRTGVDVQDRMQMQAGVADVTRFMVTREQGDDLPPIPMQPVLASGDL